MKQALPRPPLDDRIPVLMEPAHPGVDPPSMAGPHQVLVRAFGISEDGRKRHTLVPARSSRWVDTRLRCELAQNLLPLASSPRGLMDMGLETLGYRLENEELQINLLSLKHEAVQIPHGTPIALLHFVSMFRIELKDARDE